MKTGYEACDGKSLNRTFPSPETNLVEPVRMK
jgi:hypothetical protein